MHGVWRNILAASRSITTISQGGRRQRRSFSSFHCILKVQRKAINIRSRDTHLSQFQPFLRARISLSTSIAARDLMDIEKKPTGIDGGNIPHDQDSLLHDLPVTLTTSITDTDQKAEPTKENAGDASHDHPSMSHDLDVDAATSPVDRSGIQSGTDSKEEDSPGSSPPQSPKGDDGGAGDAYTKRGYTSEIFKIELSNLPKRLSFTVSKKKFIACVITVYSICNSSIVGPSSL